MSLLYTFLFSKASLLIGAEILAPMQKAMRASSSSLNWFLLMASTIWSHVMLGLSVHNIIKCHWKYNNKFYTAKDIHQKISNCVHLKEICLDKLNLYTSLNKCFIPFIFSFSNRFFSACSAHFSHTYSALSERAPEEISDRITSILIFFRQCDEHDGFLRGRRNIHHVFCNCKPVFVSVAFFKEKYLWITLRTMYIAIFNYY